MCETSSVDVALSLCEVLITPKGENACGFCDISHILLGVCATDEASDTPMGDGGVWSCEVALLL